MRHEAESIREKTPRPDFQVLVQGASDLGISLEAEQIEKFKDYFAEIKTWANKVNLVGRAVDRDVILKDFLDSLTIVKYLSRGASLLDLGSGAGFPGIPVKIARPDLRVVLLESSQKKFHFLRHIIRLLNLSEIEARWTREEKDSTLFEVVVSRAFGSLPEFASVAVRRLKKDGLILAMKGRTGEAELADSLTRLKGLGLQPAFIEHFRLPVLGHERSVIALKRT